VTYSVGCFKSVDWRDPEPCWDDCLGPQSDFLADLERAMAP
jgi:hypothetical protein